MHTEHDDGLGYLDLSEVESVSHARIISGFADARCYLARVICGSEGVFAGYRELDLPEIVANRPGQLEISAHVVAHTRSRHTVGYRAFLHLSNAAATSSPSALIGRAVGVTIAPPSRPAHIMGSLPVPVAGASSTP